MATEYVDIPYRPGCLVQLLWFLFIGWWAVHIWASIAWALMVSIVGIPLAIWMLHRIPLVVALRNPREVRYRMVKVGKGECAYEVAGAPQYHFLVRAVYVVLIDWWLSAVWMALASVVCSTLSGLPVRIWMFDLVPALVSPQR
jgi:uncharacterized membrane protein YccF (DUF307 family)